MVEKFRDCHEIWIGRKCILFTYTRMKHPLREYSRNKKTDKIYHQWEAQSYYYTIFRRESLTKFFYDEIEKYEKIRRYTIDEDNF